MSTGQRDQTARRPTYLEAHTGIAKHETSTMRVGLPAVVHAYDEATQTCSCQPVFTSDDGTRMPVVNEVPVMFPQGGGFSITWPLQAGDYVWLAFADRSLERWLAQGNFRTPLEGRRFDLSDAVAHAGLRPSRSPLAGASATDLVIQSDNATVRIEPDGTVSISASQIHLGGEGLSEKLARADRVESELGALKTAIENAVPLANDGGSQFKTQLLSQLSSWPGSTESDKVHGD